MASKRGFASMDPKRQKEIASMGGKASSTNFKNLDRSKVSEIASKGGKAAGKKRKEEKGE